MTPTTEQLKDLLAKVTPGEWHVDARETRVDNFGNIQYDPPRIVWPQNESSGSICKCHLRGGDDPDQALSNATLIALAPTLAAEVVRLRIVADAFKELLATVEGECPSLVDEDSGASQVLLNLLWDARQALDATSAE